MSHDPENFEIVLGGGRLELDRRQVMRFAQRMASRASPCAG
jgi:hypothetical protein